MAETNTKVVSIERLSHYDYKIKEWSLANHFKKSETYDKSTIDSLISGIAQFKPEITTVNPATRTDVTATDVGKFLLYKPTAADHYEEYIGVDLGAGKSPRYKFEKIGDTDIKLTNYYTKSDCDGKFATKDELAAETHAREELETDFDGEIQGVKGRLTTAEGKITTLEGAQVIADGTTIVKGADKKISVGPDSIGSSHLRDNAVTSDKIDGGAVTTDKLDAGAVTTAKMANKAVTADKVSDSAALSGGQLATASSSTKGAVKIGSGLEMNGEAVRIKSDGYTIQINESGEMVVGDDSIDEQHLTPTYEASLEKKANKVSSFQATPDDNHYPTEKLVKDALDAKQNTLAFATDAEIDLLFD